MGEIEVVRLRQGSSPTTALALIRDAERRFRNAQGLSNLTDRYSAYLEAAAESQRLLSSCLAADEIERLFLGPTFHAFSGAWLLGSPGVITRLDHELSSRVAILSSAAEGLQHQIEMWAYEGPETTFSASRLHALVLDTCVLEEHPSRDELVILAPQWLERAGRQISGIALAIAATTVDEIDGHKSANGTMHGTKKVLRQEARKAQKLIADLVPDPRERALISDPFHFIYGVLQMRPLDATRLPIADNDIVSYALDLSPFAETVTFISYDLGPCITARQQGLNALRLEYPKETD